MKRLFFYIALSVLFSMNCVMLSAQDVKEDQISNVEILVSYKMKQLWDYPNQYRDDTLYLDKTLRLEIGDGRTHSFVVSERNNIKSSFKQFASKGKWRVDFDITALLGETYINYPKSGELTQIMNLDAAGIYQYTETVPDLNWKIEPEHKTIMDYDCQRATCSFRGRDYEAWFAADIPLSFGPWKFHGLPGLILEIYDTKDEYHFTANAIEKQTETPMMIFSEDMRKITREKVLKMEEAACKDHGAYGADYDVKIVIGYEHLEHQPMPYHPLELK